VRITGALGGEVKFAGDLAIELPAVIGSGEETTAAEHIEATQFIQPRAVGKLKTCIFDVVSDQLLQRTAPYIVMEDSLKRIGRDIGYIHTSLCTLLAQHARLVDYTARQREGTLKLALCTEIESMIHGRL